MKILGVIPARYHSTRFPGKSLAIIDGKSMIRRVYEQCLEAKSLDEVWVATDDNRIRKEIESIGGIVKMTSSDHLNGTERIAECVKNVAADFIVNIQGDEPFIHPEQIDELTSLFHPDLQLGTLVSKINHESEITETGTIKVVLDRDNTALYFSRSPIPFVRDKVQNTDVKQLPFWKHIGIYGYRRDILMEISKLDPTSLEQVESLEQLRWLENGYRIEVGITSYTSQSVDTPEDLERLKLNQVGKD